MKLIIIATSIVVIAYIAIFTWATVSPVNVGLSETGLSPCPSNKQNCINTNDGEEPLDVSIADLAEALKSMGANIVIQDDNYLHATFTSTLFRFVDDFEALQITPNKLQFRSASRTGYSDLGVNAKRLIEIKSLLNTQN